MSRSITSLICVVLASHVATAAPADLSGVLKAHLRELDAERPGKLGLTGDAMIVVYGRTESVKTVVSATKHLLAGREKRPPQAATVGRSADVPGVVWFQLPFKAERSDDARWGHVERFGGLALEKSGTWQLAGVAYSELQPDDVLFDNPELISDPFISPPSISGDRGLGRAFATWFADGFARHAATGDEIIASGTSPTEFAVGAKARKLVGGWDRLKLVPASIEAKTFSGGRAAMVRAEVYLPRKGKAIRMAMVAVLVRERDGWRWGSIQYTVPM